MMILHQMVTLRDLVMKILKQMTIFTLYKQKTLQIIMNKLTKMESNGLS